MGLHRFPSALWINCCCSVIVGEIAIAVSLHFPSLDEICLLSLLLVKAMVAGVIDATDGEIAIAVLKVFPSATPLPDIF
jgi:uncharacterized membrane protein